MSTFASKPTAPRHNVVETQSVQAQFASLTRDRDALRREMEAADRERKRNESTLVELRNLQSTLNSQMHQAHATLGVETKKKQLLVQEKGRLEAMLSKERQELEQSQEQLEMLQHKEKKEKQVFLEQMHSAQDELEGLLNNLEEARWKRLISLSTAGMAPDADGLADALALLQEAYEKKLYHEEIHQKLEEERNGWRARAEQESDVDYQQLENVWEMDEDQDHTIQMKLFYGQNGSVETAAMDVNASQEDPAECH